MNELQETDELRVRHRPHTSIAIDIPTDVLETLAEVAHERDMSVEALIRFYIGRCLREDRPRMYAPAKKRNETPETQTVGG